ncbi:hypothetical protein ElyMa_001037500 [Elysia marginata]|uniref:Uncharacterized protein n=1 Tax=Elysia marginata TaxID=1093978 RepID=A0AAV4HQ08_9GAST|nr:hypothetical protein ElyMa_001037500 [Elysia marginata]
MSSEEDDNSSSVNCDGIDFKWMKEENDSSADEDDRIDRDGLSPLTKCRSGTGNPGTALSELDLDLLDHDAYEEVLPNTLYLDLIRVAFRP